MKKILFVFTLILGVVLSGCNSDDDNTTSFTAKQKEALITLNGKFKDTQFVVDPNEINFNKSYSEPIDLASNSSDKVGLYGLCGECDYYNGTIETIPCYFSLKSDASVIYFWYKGGSKDKELYKAFDLYITNIDEFKLFGDLTLPYVYKRQ